jgi:hypothetical protein
LFLEVDDNDARASTTTSGAAAAAAAEPGSEEATARVVVKWRAGPKGRAPEKGPPVGACGGVSRGSAGRTHGGRTTGGDVALTFFNGRDTDMGLLKRELR